MVNSSFPRNTLVIFFLLSAGLLRATCREDLEWARSRKWYRNAAMKFVPKKLGAEPGKVGTVEEGRAQMRENLAAFLISYSPNGLHPDAREKILDFLMAIPRLERGTILGRIPHATQAEVDRYLDLLYMALTRGEMSGMNALQRVGYPRVEFTDYERAVGYGWERGTREGQIRARADAEIALQPMLDRAIELCVLNDIHNPSEIAVSQTQAARVFIFDFVARMPPDIRGRAIIAFEAVAPETLALALGQIIGFNEHGDFRPVIDITTDEYFQNRLALVMGKLKLPDVTQRFEFLKQSQTFDASNGSHRDVFRAYLEDIATHAEADARYLGNTPFTDSYDVERMMSYETLSDADVNVLHRLYTLALTSGDFVGQLDSNYLAIYIELVLLKHNRPAPSERGWPTAEYHLRSNFAARTFTESFMDFRLGQVRADPHDTAGISLQNALLEAAPSVYIYHTQMGLLQGAPSLGFEHWQIGSEFIPQPEASSWQTFKAFQRNFIRYLSAGNTPVPALSHAADISVAMTYLRWRADWTQGQDAIAWFTEATFYPLNNPKKRLVVRSANDNRALTDDENTRLRVFLTDEQPGDFTLDLRIPPKP